MIQYRLVHPEWGTMVISPTDAEDVVWLTDVTHARAVEFAKEKDARRIAARWDPSMRIVVTPFVYPDPVPLTPADPRPFSAEWWHQGATDVGKFVLGLVALVIIVFVLGTVGRLIWKLIEFAWS
jgi:hypothetical protein